jgi:hypothetical protein
MRKQVKSALVVISDGTGGSAYYSRGDVIDLPDDHPKWPSLVRDDHVVDVGALEIPLPERAQRVTDEPTGVVGHPAPIVGRPIGTGDPEADARAAVFRQAALSARGLPLADDVEDIDDPGTDTRRDTALVAVNPNPAPAVVPVPAAVPAVSPFAGVSETTEPDQPSATLDMPIRAAAKADWVAYVASLPAGRRDDLDSESIATMTKQEIVSAWGGN